MIELFTPEEWAAGAKAIATAIGVTELYKRGVKGGMVQATNGIKVGTAAGAFL